jgi:3'(2'),5'-bisphosphate nucleotidase
MTSAALRAGAIIMGVYSKPFEAERKRDGSPVTEADTAAEASILHDLGRTGLPCLAEESVAAGRIPELGDRYFVIDPLDGTKEFLHRNGEFTVNIALVEAGRPVLGVVYAPDRGLLFTGSPEGALECTVTEGTPDQSHPITARSGGMRIVGSRSHGREQMAELCRVLGVEADVTVGSSLKFCLVARGDAQLYPRLGPTCEWDTAAGQAVLGAAGGAVLALDGSPLAYGKTEDGFLNPNFAAASSLELARKLCAQMVKLSSR